VNGMGVLLILLAFLFVICLGGAATFGVIAVRTTRAVRQRAPQARRAVEDVAIKARSFARPGAHGEVAALRSQVRGALAASRRTLEAGASSDPQLQDALGLLTRLDTHARDLDAHLHALELEPDAARVASRLPAVRERADRIVHSASSLRWAAQDRAHRLADDELARLAEECDTEASALRHWSPGRLPQ